MADDLTEARLEINRIDGEMAELFLQRMAAVKRIAAYKRERGLPIRDESRERAVIEHNLGYIPREELRSFYVRFMQSVMDVSRLYQQHLMTREEEDA